MALAKLLPSKSTAVAAGASAKVSNTLKIRVGWRVGCVPNWAGHVTHTENSLNHILKWVCACRHTKYIKLADFKTGISTWFSRLENADIYRELISHQYSQAKKRLLPSIKSPKASAKRQLSISTPLLFHSCPVPLISPPRFLCPALGVRLVLSRRCRAIQ